MAIVPGGGSLRPAAESESAAPGDSLPGSVVAALPEPAAPAAPPSEALSPTLDITVKRLDGSEISFEVSRAETVRDIKARLEVRRPIRSEILNLESDAAAILSSCFNLNLIVAYVVIY